MKKSLLRAIAALLGMCFCFITIFSIAFIVLHSHHECTGEGCPICSEIAFAVSTLQTISEAVEKAAIALIAVYLPILTLIGLTDAFTAAETSITLKVKLNI